MEALIPAAGVGTRLRPHTLTIPKVLLNVAGKPIIAHIIDRLVEKGVTQFTLIIGYHGDKVKTYLTSHYDVSFRFVEQPERKGLGHAVGLGLRETDEPVLIVLGDTIFNADFSDFISTGENLIGVVEVEDPRRFGIVEAEGNQVRLLVEKPEKTRSNLAIAGIYTLQSQQQLKRAVEYIIEHDVKTRGEFQLTDALQRLLTNGESIRIKKIEGWYDCGTQESLIATNRYLLAKNGNNFQGENSVIIAPTFIHPDCQIKNSVIGPNVTIDAGTKVINSIVKESIIGKNSVIENGIITHTLVGDHSHIVEKPRSYNIGDYTQINFH